MKYDDVSWHLEGAFPDGLPEKAAATPTGMFFAWCVLSGLASNEHLADFAPDVALLKARATTPAEHLLKMDGKFSSADLSREGNQFASAYYEAESGFLDDYEDTVGEEFPTLYHVPDTWEVFDRLAARIAARYQAWKRDAR